MSDKDLEALYESLKQPGSIKAYEESDKDTLDTLFGFVDFQKFKEQMLSFKNAHGADDQGKAETGATGELLSWDKFQEIFAEDTSDKAQGWKKKVETKDKDFEKTGFKCTIHQKKRGKGLVDMIRLDAKMLKADPAGIMNYFYNPPKEKSSMMKEVRTLEERPDGKVVYWRFKLPLMSDRDNICFIKETKQDDGSLFIQCTTEERDDVPPVKGVVRMYMYVSCWVRPDASNPELWHFTEIELIDFGGKIPPALLNMALASDGLKEFKTMYNHIRIK